MVISCAVLFHGWLRYDGVCGCAWRGSSVRELAGYPHKKVRGVPLIPGMSYAVGVPASSITCAVLNRSSDVGLATGHLAELVPDAGSLAVCSR